MVDLSSCFVRLLSRIFFFPDNRLGRRLRGYIVQSYKAIAISAPASEVRTVFPFDRSHYQTVCAQRLAWHWQPIFDVIVAASSIELHDLCLASRRWGLNSKPRSSS